jgi:hypothetical protein
VLFWYLRISRSATVPGRKRCGFFTPPVAGADLRAALVASCFRGALPPVDLRAVCFVRAIRTGAERSEQSTDLDRAAAARADWRIRVGVSGFPGGIFVLIVTHEWLWKRGMPKFLGGAGGEGTLSVGWIWTVRMALLVLVIHVLDDSARPLAEAALARITGSMWAFSLSCDASALTSTTAVETGRCGPMAGWAGGVPCSLRRFCRLQKWPNRKTGVVTVLVLSFYDLSRSFYCSTISVVQSRTPVFRAQEKNKTMAAWNRTLDLLR